MPGPLSFSGENRRCFALSNNGSGTFTNSGQSLANQRSDDVAFGDIDGDGDLDAMTANYNQPNKVWLNNGSGTFTDSGQSLGSTENSDAVAFGDVDGDGDLDAIITAYTDPTEIWLNN